MATSRRRVDASLSPNTRRAYAGALRRLDAWLADRTLDDTSLALYLAGLHATGRPGQRRPREPGDAPRRCPRRPASRPRSGFSSWVQSFLCPFQWLRVVLQLPAVAHETPHTNPAASQVHLDGTRLSAFSLLS